MFVKFSHLAAYADEIAPIRLGEAGKQFACAGEPRIAEFFIKPAAVIGDGDIDFSPILAVQFAGHEGLIKIFLQRADDPRHLGRSDGDGAEDISDGLIVGFLDEALEREELGFGKFLRASAA